tara:strand:- start:104 stop:448 length:345 start_codon:yes stop_codon:yes gene_type:complete
MKKIFENFRQFTDLQENKIKDLVDEYYSDLSDEEKSEKEKFFTNKLESGIKRNGEWMRKTLLHAIESRMKIEKRRRERSPEEVESDKEVSIKAKTRSDKMSREMTKKYGRRWNR